MTLEEVVATARPSIIFIETSKLKEGNPGNYVGSGFVFETPVLGSALVSTNAHVVEGVYTWSKISESYLVWVTINDSVRKAASIIGVDSVRDLAVLRILYSGHEFSAMELGDAVSKPEGTSVYAMGYPSGVTHRATTNSGIVSNFNYENDSKRWVIQHDADINPGNSGGPLFTISGEVVGINTYRREQTTSGRILLGMNYAVSAATVQEQLLLLKSGAMAPQGPTPQIITESARGYNKLVAVLTWDYTVEVKATVKNVGGPGIIEVMATVNWDGESKTKSTKVLMDTNDEKTLVFEFLEPGAQSKITYEVDAVLP